MAPQQIVDAILLGLIFGIAGITTIEYYRRLPSAESLRQRLPNRISWIGVILTLLIASGTIYIFQTTSGRTTFFRMLSLIYFLLFFESILFLLFNKIRSNTLAIIYGATLTAGWAWLLLQGSSVTLYNITFIVVALGAPSFLVHLGYLRTRYLFAIAGLWTVYDIISNVFIYPTIYLPIAKPIPSFRFPSLISGNLTLGLGDVVFLSLFTLVLLRDRSRRWALVHIGLQTAALMIAAAVKPASIQFPYLTVLVPIFFLVWWWSDRRTKNALK